MKMVQVAGCKLFAEPVPAAASGAGCRLVTENIKQQFAIIRTAIFGIRRFLLSTDNKRFRFQTENKNFEFWNSCCEK